MGIQAFLLLVLLKGSSWILRAQCRCGGAHTLPNCNMMSRIQSRPLIAFEAFGFGDHDENNWFGTGKIASASLFVTCPRISL
ncbi:hypothetical protein TIFTF001_007507 [Ficus carica]|uniref:Secreted protein n=1 Tax=Ficus carica TaxID=3494 RepID=A0AA87ZQB3_FICCA|nr:hypothetical protein TIFTF001_007507 [Ficus carica]